MNKRPESSLIRLTTPPVRVSFPYIYTPNKNPDGTDGKYSAKLMFDKTNPEHKAFLKEKLLPLLNRVLIEAWPDEKQRPKIPLIGHDRSVVKDGDTACSVTDGAPVSEKYPELAGHYVINAGSKRPLTVVDRFNQPLNDPDAFYGGCVLQAVINFFPYDNTNKGISCGLVAVRKCSTPPGMDDSPFSGGGPIDVEEAFGKPEMAGDVPLPGDNDFDSFLD